MKSIFLLLLLNSGMLKAQLTIKGPDCVLAEFTYEYQFEVPADSPAESVKACIKGGSIEGSTSECVSGISLRTIRIKWSELVNQGSLVVKVSSGSVSKNITITPELRPGNITSALVQTIDYKKIPASIICSPAKGGGCTANFSYQWQISTDNVSWADIAGSTSQNLSYKNYLLETTFFDEG